jgi:hypothetical protein
MGAGMSGWRTLSQELARWRDEGRTADFWWRDDDAGAVSPALERLLELARESGVPLALAVVPAQADPALLARLDSGVTVLQHGTDHVNRAGAGEKKSEFPDSEAVASALARLKGARERLRAHARGRLCAALAPPWNRLAPGLVPHLKESGYAGLSQYGARKRAEPSPGLRQVNTHLDIIAWHAGRGFVGEDEALRLAVAHLAARRTGAADRGEPTGLLTHHACHDEAAWGFIERLFATARDAGAPWREAAELFR